jgi:hypothetical protein
MAFSSNNTVVGNKLQQPENIVQAPVPVAVQNQLNAQELALLIGIIKQTSFLGEHIELTYNTIIKLQNQYLQQTK